MESKFSKSDVKIILEALWVFLSFSFGKWTPPVLVVGLNDTSGETWQLRKNFDIAPEWNLKGWITKLLGTLLSDAFPGFLELWMKENWREPLILSVTWLIEASKNSGSLEGAIAFGQIPLEMLALEAVY